MAPDENAAVASVTGIALAFEHPADAQHVRVDSGGTHIVSLHPDARERLLAAALDLQLEPGTRLTLLGNDAALLDIGQCRALRARIGFLPISGGLLSQLNGWENISLPLGFHAPERLEEKTARVRDLLSELGADADVLLAKLPEHMSYPETRIIACARALLEEPELLLVEEGGRGLASGNQSWAARVDAAYHAACPRGTLVRLVGDARGGQAGHAASA